MKLTPSERQTLNQHVAAIRRILRVNGWSAMQLRLNINEHAMQSFDYKVTERISVDESARDVAS